MPRKVVPPSNELPYHITARSRNRENFPIPRQEVWGLMEDYLFFISMSYGIEILTLGKGRLHFPLYPDEILFESCDQTLRWINDTPNSYDTEVIKQSLRKGVFDVATDRRTGRPRELLLNPY